MFGFSLTKLLFTIAIVLIVWYGFKMVGRLDAERKQRVKAAARKTPKSRRSEAASNDTEDMVACPSCGTYVSVGGARACGRDDCPYPG